MPHLRTAKSTGSSDIMGSAMSHDSEPIDPATFIGYFDPHQPVSELQGNLPHWRQEGVTYFVTFRLADSIPQSTLDLWVRQRDDWLRRHSEPRTPELREEYYRLFVERFHRWLD